MTTHTPATHEGKTVYLASDHAGFAHKAAIYEWLRAEGWTVVDLGPESHDPEDDFPLLIAPAAEVVARHPLQACAVIFGGSGQGEAMVANRFAGVRATVFYGGNDEIVRLSREHNNANILSLGARFVTVDEAKRVIWEWLHAPASDTEKYHRRNRQLDTVV